MIGAFVTRRLRVLSMATLCSAGAVPSVSADPVTVAVTSGILHIEADEIPFFNFRGDGFSLRGAYSGGEIWPCTFGCTAGSVTDMSTTVLVGPGRGFGLFYGAIVNGTPISVDDRGGVLLGRFQFDAPTVFVPSLGFFHTAPFVFSGLVTGFAPDDGRFETPLFHVALRGRGVANVDLAPEGLTEYHSVTYTFEATSAPVPEPTSILLLGTGLAGIAARRWRNSARRG